MYFVRRRAIIGDRFSIIIINDILLVYMGMCAHVLTNTCSMIFWVFVSVTVHCRGSECTRKM